VARLRNITLKQDNLENAKLNNADVRAWFPDGSFLVFRLDGVDKDTLTGYSQNFGTTRFRISAISRIEFNIHDRKLQEKRGATAW
jgi:hypothetical protein